MASEATAWRPASHLQSIRQLSGGESLVFRLRLGIGRLVNSTQIEVGDAVYIHRSICWSSLRRMPLDLIELLSNALNARD
jgi:hypothetical protein